MAYFWAINCPLDLVGLPLGCQLAQWGCLGACRVDEGHMLDHKMSATHKMSALWLTASEPWARVAYLWSMSSIGALELHRHPPCFQTSHIRPQNVCHTHNVHVANYHDI